MSRHLLPRLVALSATAAMWLTLVATPVAAVSLTRLVDDNGVQCPAAHYTSIQDAIDDSSAGDRVEVCAGTYTEQLVIDKSITVRAKGNLGATLVAPAVMTNTGGLVSLVRIEANDAKFNEFNINIEAGIQQPIFTAAVVCTHVDVAIYVLGTSDMVRGNHIAATGGIATLTGNCGYDYGIVIGQQVVAASANPNFPVSSASGHVTFNWVTDFKAGGILVEGSNTYAFIRRNTLRYLHLNDPLCTINSSAPSTNAPGQNGLIIICVISVAPSTPVNSAFALSFGIGVESGAEADVIRNAIFSGPKAVIGPVGPPGVNADAHPSGPSTPATPRLGDGISLSNLDGSETTTVFHNAIWRVGSGIHTIAAADGATVSYNAISLSAFGLKIDADADVFHHNEASGNQYGVEANGSNNNIHDNNFHDNSVIDCYDSTTGSGTASTANTWTGNSGATDLPDGICGS